MAESLDHRTSSVIHGVQGMEEPQSVYKDLPRTGIARFDGLVNLFSYRDIVAVNRNRTVLGTGGSGSNYLGNARPRIPQELDGVQHAKWRRVLDPLFSPKKVAVLEGAIRELAGRLIDGFVGDGEVEIYSRFCSPLPSSIFIRLLGAPQSDMPFFMEFKEAVLRAAGETGSEMTANAQMAAAPMLKYLENLVAQRRALAAQPDDLIGAFLAAEIDGRPLTDDELVDLLYEMLLGGLDTIAASLSLIISWLARHPETRRRVVEDPSLTVAAVEEIMRVETTIPGLTRYATEDIDLGDGEVIRKGEVIHTVIAAANLDPEQFDDPTQVKLNRAKNPHLAFSSGTHRCLGSHLARLELRAALEEFHQRIPEYDIKPGERAEYNNVVIRTAYRLPLVFTAAETVRR